MGKSGKSASVEIHSQGIVAGAEDVDAHIELSASEEKRVEDIPLTNIVFN